MNLSALMQLFKRPLFANSLWLLLAQLANYSTGFFFWVVIAKSYTPEAVGVGAAILAVVALLAFLSQLGIGYGFIRYIVLAGPNSIQLVNEGFTTVALAACLFAALFVGTIDIWSPGLVFLRQDLWYALIFVGLTVLNALYYLFHQAYVAVQHAGFAFSISVMHGFGKIIAAVGLAALVGGLGIIVSWLIVFAIVALLSFTLFLPRVLPGYRPQPRVGRQFLGEIGVFSIANHISIGMWALPSAVLPQMVLSNLGSEQNAYFALTWAIVMMPFAVPAAVSTALFAEGSYNVSALRDAFWRALGLCAGILLPVGLVLLLAGGHLLRFFGEGYAQEGTLLLVVAVFAVIPGMLNQLYLGIASVQKWLRQLLIITGSQALLTVLVATLLLPYLGILAAGFGLLVSHLVIALFVIPRIYSLFVAKPAVVPDQLPGVEYIGKEQP